MRSSKLKNNWYAVVKRFSDRFADGEEMDVDGILFLIGVQETGKGYKRYKKDEKVDLIHVAICKLLSYYGYYEYVGIDDQGWPHYKNTDTLPNLKAGEQGLLIKEAIVRYAQENRWI